MGRDLSRRGFIRSTGILGLGALGAAGLAACGGSEAPAAPAAEATAPQGEAPAAAGLPPADLSVWIWYPDPLVWINPVAEAFTDANPEVKVVAEAPADYWTKLQTALAGGAGPDVYFMNSVNYWSWISKGTLPDISSYVDADEVTQDFIANGAPAAIDFYKFEGKWYGLPVMYGTTVLYYNEDYIKEMGLTLPADMEDDFDWIQWREYANTLTQREGDSTTMWGVSTQEGIQSGWLNFVRGNGGDFLNAEATKCIIDEPPSVEAWQLLTDMLLEDKVSPSSEALQAEGTRSMFMTGKVAMLPGGSWVMNTLNEQLTDFTYNIAILPKSPNTGERGGTSNIVGIVMNRDGKAKDQAWGLMSALVSKDSQDRLAQGGGEGPVVRMDSSEQYYGDPAIGPSNRAAAVRMGEWTTPLPTHRTVTWGEMMDPTTEWQTEISEGRVSVQEGLTNMAAAVNDLFG
ncbi:MAG: sugar ABC transporter substrate-binding protein [Anaerolineae bacterium]|nr:sugar ABC transporter substrate-binding protein [Anaerolineae bacterium]